MPVANADWPKAPPEHREGPGSNPREMPTEVAPPRLHVKSQAPQDAASGSGPRSDPAPSCRGCATRDRSGGLSVSCHLVRLVCGLWVGSVTQHVAVLTGGRGREVTGREAPIALRQDVVLASGELP